MGLNLRLRLRPDLWVDLTAVELTDAQLPIEAQASVESLAGCVVALCYWVCWVEGRHHSASVFNHNLAARTCSGDKNVGV